ncbi:hypothetical protein MLD38_006647 [Melastoma candidum]|uniref:Uncharacterized protein n=1 Tax=Melastoma candidum TaxID=119954 RepID=A0ACB9RN96_9MYRT|nr:hypothetical protein MLD38_006647 [Melastoma candidum]
MRICINKDVGLLKINKQFQIFSYLLFSSSSAFSFFFLCFSAFILFVTFGPFFFCFSCFNLDLKLLTYGSKGNSTSIN